MYIFELVCFALSYLLIPTQNNNQVSMAATPGIDNNIILAEELSSSGIARVLTEDNDDRLLSCLLSDGEDDSDDEVEEILRQARRRRAKNQKFSLAIALSFLIAIPNEPYYLHPNRIRSVSQAYDYWVDNIVFEQQFRFPREHFLILADKLQIPTSIQVGK